MAHEEDTICGDFQGCRHGSVAPRLCWSIAASQMCWIDTQQPYNDIRQDAAVLCCMQFLPTAHQVTLAQCHWTYVQSPLYRLKSRVHSLFSIKCTSSCDIKNHCEVFSCHVQREHCLCCETLCWLVAMQSEDSCFKSDYNHCTVTLG